MAHRPGPADAIDLAYEAFGAPGKPVLLLIHGGTASRRAWDLVTPDLRAGYRIIAVDLRGHGQSPVPSAGYSAPQLKADVNRLIDKLGLERITLVGHSLGGMTAILLAASRPDVVERLILLNAPVTPNAIHALTGLASRVHSPGFFPLSQAFIEEWSPPPLGLPAVTLATQRAHLLALHEVVWKQMFGELARTDITTALKEVKQPTLILWGAKDGLLGPAQHQQLQAGIANSRLVVIDDAGHSPHTATPARVAAEIAAFAA